MRASRLVWVGVATVVVGCASAGMGSGGGESGGTDVRPPLGAHLSAGAKTGAPIPLRFDPNAKVVIATVPNLPAASYAGAQATRGQQVYEQVCASCHQTEQFIGPQFVESWNDRRVGDFYSLVRGTMPVDNPGGLKDQEYLDVVAYLLKANRAATGPDSMSADTTFLRGRRISVHP